jgi:hypothetical protein
MHHLTTISLVQLDQERKPINHASACLVKYRDHLFVLTVAHATGNQGNWAIEMRYVPGKGVELYQLGGMGFLTSAKIKHNKLKSKEVDFSYKLLAQTLAPRHQVLSTTGVVMSDEPKLTLESDLSLSPDPSGKYGFWGLTRQTFDSHNLVAAPKLELGMKFAQTEGDRFFFKTCQPYKTYKDYYGCSGAPILASDGKLVSMVVEGDKRKTGIYGLDLRNYRCVLDVEIDMALNNAPTHPPVQTTN